MSTSWNETIEVKAQGIQLNEESFLTQKDKVEIIAKIDGLKSGIFETGDGLKKDLRKAIYIAGVIQVLVTIVSALFIINSIHK